MSHPNEKDLYFRENKWPPKLTKRPSKPKQKVFRYGCVEILCPTVTVYHS